MSEVPLQAFNLVPVGIGSLAPPAILLKYANPASTLLLMSEVPL